MFGVGCVIAGVFWNFAEAGTYFRTDFFTDYGGLFPETWVLSPR
jgi:hypothetical protein